MGLIIQNSNYNGEVLNRLLTNAITGCQIVDKGLICVIPSVKDKLAIPRLKVNKMLRKPNSNPEVKDSKGDFIYSEHQLKPEEMLAFTVFNPDTFDHIWRPFQPKGNLVFYELPPNVQNELLDAMSKQIQFELGWHFINGEHNDDPADDEHLMNGILYRLKNDPDVIVISSDAETITGKLYAIRSRIPVAIKELSELRYIMSPADWEKYDEELTKREHKNSDETELNKKSFKGVKIETLVGWPDGLIIATLCSPHEMTSNLFAAVNLVNDDKVIQIDKVSNASDLYFFKMKMRADTNCAFGEEVIVLDSRENPEFTPTETADGGESSEAQEEEQPVVYGFESYNPADHTQKWGEGKVAVLSQSGGKTRVIVLTNTPTDPNAADFAGMVFVVDATEPETGTFYALKTTGGTNVGIDVKITLLDNEEIQEG